MWFVLGGVADADVEDFVACACQGPCAHAAPVLDELVIPPLHPRRVQVQPLDRQGLVEMAYRRGAGPILAMAVRRALAR